MFNFIFLKEVFKSAFCIAVLVSLIGIELSPSVGQNLLECLPAEPNLSIASLSSCKAFSLVEHQNWCKYISCERTIIKNHADIHLFAIMITGTPIKMYQG